VEIEKMKLKVNLVEFVEYFKVLRKRKGFVRGTVTFYDDPIKNVEAVIVSTIESGLCEELNEEFVSGGWRPLHITDLGDDEAEQKFEGFWE
jgi:hypothetical protein